MYIPDACIYTYIYICIYDDILSSNHQHVVQRYVCLKKRTTEMTQMGPNLESLTYPGLNHANAVLACEEWMLSPVHVSLQCRTYTAGLDK